VLIGQGDRGELFRVEVFEVKRQSRGIISRAPAYDCVAFPIQEE
jgi:hypothetical protein